MSIWRPVRRVAGNAALYLYRFMLKHKRATLIGVAGEANGILRGGRSYLICFNRTVRIVAVNALHQPFIYPVVKGHGELRLLLCVARIAKFRLRLHQQKFRILAVVRRMAIQAAHVVLDVHRPAKIHLFLTGSVARHAAFADRFRARRLETENLLQVARIVGMRRARPMATFATLMRRATALVQQRLVVRRFFVVCEKVFVADLARLRTHVTTVRRRLLRGAGRRRRLFCGVRERRAMR